MIRSRKWSYVLLLPVLVLLMGARQVPLTDPDPIAVPAGLAQEQIAKAIKVALVDRGWLISEDAPGRILTTLHLRSHTARVEITYDDRAVSLMYLESENLMYEEKRRGRYIHRNYLSWVQNLVTDISGNLQLAALE